MSVLIKGMEMPYNCWDCSLLNASSCPCKNYSSALEYTTNRHPNCPLVPVPEPHGRLIDADAYEKLLRGLGNRDYRREVGTLQDAVKLLHPHYAPTIIPADTAAEGE